MSYTALYRKFRPDNFADVKGQDHIVTTLRNQLKTGRIGHAYLFTGTRGTGKTTVAKILAKAVNCTNPTDNGPCGECEVCRGIANGSSMNVIEIDAASNNGVDNIREIIEAVSYRPTEGKYKVYIIDEVHMLSTGAFNAMLKTLEEPPEYVIFILATTEVHKLPITVLSRCQRYDFKRISIDTIASRMQELIDAEGEKVEEKAVRYIAKTADGSMRDGLSLLDQCLAFNMGEVLTYDRTLEVLGAVDTEVFSRLLRAVLGRDVNTCISLVDEIVTQGRELTQFVTDFTWYLRNLMLVQTGDALEDVVDMSSENLGRLKEEAQMADRNQIIRYIRIFSELSGQIRYSNQKRILVEVALIKQCRPAMEKDDESLYDRIVAIEQRLESGVFVAGGALPAGAGDGASAGVGLSGSAAAAVPTPAQMRAKLPTAIPEDVEKIVRNWRQVLNNMSDPTHANFMNVKPTLGEDGQLILAFDADDLSIDRAQSEATKEQLAQIFSDLTGKQVNFTIRAAQTKNEFSEGMPDLRELIHFEVTEE